MGALTGYTAQQAASTSYSNGMQQMNNQAAMQQSFAKYPMDHSTTKRQAEEADLLLTNPGLISIKQTMKRVNAEHELELLELWSQYDMMLALLRKPLEDL